MPALVRDPTWSYRMWPAEVSIGGFTFNVGPMSAADWLPYLTQSPVDLDGVVLHILPGADERLYNGDLDLEHLYRSCLDVIGTISGRRWWVALRLIHQAHKYWDKLGGDLVLAGVRLDQVSLSAYLDAITVLIYQLIEPSQATMFSARLEMPPPSEAKTVQDEIEMSRGAFMSLDQ